MDKSEYREKQQAAERKRQETAENAYRKQVIGALERIAQQNQATENQAARRYLSPPCREAHPSFGGKKILA
jgi:hypothetical protein